MIIESAVFCLGLAIYFEGRGESEFGQKLIANILTNRVRSKKYPNNYCDVMTQYKQFSFYNGVDKINDLKTPDHKALNKSLQVAENYMENKLELIKGCNYTTLAVKNDWTRKMKVERIEGQHKFMIGGC